MNDAQLLDEQGRLAALKRYDVLDSPREGTFDKITALVRDILDVPICVVSLVDRDRQWFKSIQGLDASETPRDIAFCSHTIQKREPMLVPDATADTRFAANPLVTGDPGIRSYAGVPLPTPDGYNLGSLCVIDTRPRSFSEAQVQMLSQFAGLVVNELELRTIARRDFLTGAATRRAFVDAAEKEVDRLKRYGRVSSLLLLDIDHFKRINDQFGHPSGDEVLKAVAESCRAALRPSDMLGRLGGEEFGILLPEIDGGAARAVAERLRMLISRLRFDWARDLRVTASLGAAPLRRAQSADAWMRVTDEALYKAKRDGRDRTVCSEEPGLHAVAA
ncbi:MAG TPA: sensor domain-containing diguanylate cyclase [Allosphingosinicella sp.]|jgi:diguanylate cyclase (GGDEF)-like protein